MAKIKLKNIKIYAYHGCLIEERKIGSDYLVNLAASYSELFVNIFLIKLTCPHPFRL